MRAIIAAQAAKFAAKNGLIGTLRLQLAKLRRQQFGRSSEWLDRDIDQLELVLEDLEAEQAATAPINNGDKGRPHSPRPGLPGGRCRITCHATWSSTRRQPPVRPAAAA